MCQFPYLVIWSIRDIISYYWLAQLGVKATELRSITKSMSREKSGLLTEVAVLVYQPFISSGYLSWNNNVTVGSSQ